MSRWFRVYDGLVDDPKVQRLPEASFKALVNLWCLASQNGGRLPEPSDIAFKLRMRPEKVSALLAGLKEAGLIDEVGTSFEPHNWGSRQFKSDVSNERVKRHRERKCNVTEAVTATPPDTEADNRKKEESKEDAADAASTTGKKYEFEHGIIRLTASDFSKWEKAFSYLDLRAELIALTQWAAEQGPQNWFFAVSGALAKRNRDQKFRTEQAKQGGPARPLTPAGNPWPEGIT